LRMAGFDAAYDNQAADANLAGIVMLEGRILLTRDRFLLMRTAVNRGYWVRSTEPREQLVEVVKRFDLVGSIRAFTRCMRCNSILEETSRDSVMDRVPAGIRNKDVFHICPDCEQIYWEGSHHERMSRLLSWLRAQATGPATG